MTGTDELSVVKDLARQAGEILKRYHGTDLSIKYKTDKFDPVTIADKESDIFLRNGIHQAFPGDEILSEENPLQPGSYDGRVWMIDPLDDTKGFVAGRNTPGVMLGLLENGRPRLGVVYLPFRNEWYYAQSGSGAFMEKDGNLRKISVRSVAGIHDAILVGRNVVAGDSRPIDMAIAQLKFKSTIPEGCIGAKIGLIASGQADAFIHTNLKAGKWDTLASQVILTEAGGAMCDIDGLPLDYTKPTSGWDRYFMAANSTELLHEMVSSLRDINARLQIF